MTKILASGRLAEVDEHGRAPRCSRALGGSRFRPHRCTRRKAEWYADSPADVYTIVDCGAPLYFDAPDGTRCTHGHEFGNMERHLGEGGTEWQREQAERYAETGTVAL